MQDLKPGGLAIQKRSVFFQQPFPLRPPQFIVDVRKAKSDRKREWEETLECVCKSGLPVLRRFKVSEEWTGWCKRCK